MKLAWKSRLESDTGRAACRARNVSRWTWLCLLVGLASWSPAQTPVVTTREYKVKLAYLYNFTRYISWPAHAFEDADDPFVIGVLGPDPFGKSLDLLARRRTGKRRIVVRRFQSADQIDVAHVLFVSPSVPDEVAADLIAGGRSKRPLLLVCEAPRSAASGAPVSFYLDDNGTIGFELNVDALGRRGLRADAQLLAIAKPVRDRRTP